MSSIVELRGGGRKIGGGNDVVLRLAKQKL
jgi:hypothetical protein